MRQRLIQIYQQLLDHFGPCHWWPAQTPFEVMVGAVLTQAVAWRNVEQAIANLQQAGLLDPQRLYRADPARLEQLIRPTRYYRAKTKKLRALLEFMITQYHGDLQLMFREDLALLRRRLLQVHGLGPETVDAILLYAGNLPVLVVDEYTRRILSRLGLVPPQISYGKLQELLQAHLPAEVPFYNEFHALIDRLGNRICRSRPLCGECPLRDGCGYHFQGTAGQ